MFVHLHNHTEYSLLNGALRIQHLVSRAKAFGMPAVATTDYGNIFGAVEFFQEAKRIGIKPIIGCTFFHPSNDEHTLRSHRRGIDYLFQLVLLIQDETGYHNLCQLITKSYLEGFYYKPRIDTNLLKQFNEGLIALSGGWSSALNLHLFEGNREKAAEACRHYAAIFPGRYYVELQENGVEGQHAINEGLIDVAKEAGVGVVATNNCHYLEREDAEAFETLLCIQTGATLHGSGDHLKFSTDGYYFKSPQEMEQSFHYCPEALENTLTIAENLNFEFDLKTYYFPKFEAPENKSLDDYLKEESLKGLEDRWPHILKNRKIKPDEQSKYKSIYQERLDHELKVIQSMGFSGYFLIVSDFIRYAKGQKIPVGPGRGSAAGSLVAYCIQITDLDPLPHFLLFERFLNPERISMPDVDIDFCMNRRDEVLKYVSQKYGNVSQIITFGKMKAKAVIRDVGRVMEMPYGDVDRIAKLIPNALNITLNLALEQEPRLKELVEKDQQVGRLMEIAKRLEGLNRHASTHAAGVVISDRPLTEFLPLYKGSNGDVVTQFDMKCVEKIGLIKFDFLGLKTLTVIENTIKMVKQTRGVDVNPLEIPMDDEPVYTLLSQGDGGAVFQLESSGMKDLMTRMKPSCFADLVALVALFRPGPLGSGMVDDFINRKQGKTKIVYDVPQLEPILNDTYGVIVYQEQVMQIASLLAGYTLGEADILRRAMGKKKAEEMASQRVRFLQGCDKNKIPKYKAERIFDLMAKFAEYGFNKSHSAAYAFVSYQTAYLKTHFTEEYLASVLTTEMNNTDRVLYYLQDCGAHKIEILPPNINESVYEFTVVGEKKIRYGLGAVKNVGEGAIEAIVEARKKVGRFESFFHFFNAVEYQKINRRVIESLVKCGAFDSLEPHRAALFEAIEQAMGLAIRKQQDEGLGQTNMFGLMEESSGAPAGVYLPDIPLWHENQKLAFEKEALGFYLTGHPLQSYAAEIRRVATSNSKLCQIQQQDMEVIMAGMITQVKPITTKKGSRMAFLTFEDLKGSVEAIVFAEAYQKYCDSLSLDHPLVLQGTIDRTEEGVKIIVKEVTLLSEMINQKTRSVHFKIPTTLFTEDRIQSFHEILNSFSGACRSFLHLVEPGKSETILELPGGLSLDKRDDINMRVKGLFKESIVEYRV